MGLQPNWGRLTVSARREESTLGHSTNEEIEYIYYGSESDCSPSLKGAVQLAHSLNTPGGFLGS